MIYLLKSVTVIWPPNEKQPNILSRLRSLLAALVKDIIMLLAPSSQLFGGKALQVEAPWERGGEGVVESTHCGDNVSA